MISRRAFVTAAAATLVAARQAAASTPVATPATTPGATPAVGGWRVVGEGKLQSGNGEPEFDIDLTYDGTTFEGEFSLTVFPAPGSEWLVESTEFVSIKPLSDLSPHITRIGGYATLNGRDEQPFLLDITDGRSDDEADALNFVFGEDAAPFIGEEVKLGCDCGPGGLALISEFIEGEVTVTRP